MLYKTRKVECIVPEKKPDAGKKDEPFELHSPLTSERIRMSCGDDIANGFSKGKRPNGFW